MLDPSQEYFIVALLAGLAGLTATTRLWLWIVCIVSCALLGCALALFLLALLGPGGTPTPEFWDRLASFVPLVILSGGAGLAILEITRPPKPRPSPPPAPPSK